MFRFGSDMHCALFIGTRFNHSCDNNVRFIINNDYIDFITNVDIKKDDELFITYISSMSKKLFNNNIYRKNILLKNYGFNCTCNKCLFVI